MNTAKKRYSEGADYTQVKLQDIRQFLNKEAPLEVFAYQQEVAGDQLIHIESPELTCICPFSDMPDFGTVTIEYVPTDYCLELKSFKLFIGAFRDLKVFHEGVTEVIAAEFAAAVKPKWAEVTVAMNPRGNVTTVCKKQVGKRTE